MLSGVQMNTPAYPASPAYPGSNGYPANANAYAGYPAPSQPGNTSWNNPAAAQGGAGPAGAQPPPTAYGYSSEPPVAGQQNVQGGIVTGYPKI